MSPAGSPHAPEAKARQKIDALLGAAGWIVQDRDDLNLTGLISGERTTFVAALKPQYEQRP